MHCARCGRTLCEKHRAECIKGVVDDLRGMKSQTAVKIKTANDRRGALMRELKLAEHSRQKSKAHIMDTFRSHKFALEDQKRSVVKKLNSFAKPKLQELRSDSDIVEACIKDIKRTESHFDARLSNYNPMSDVDFSNLCQDLINYTNQINWLRDYTSKPDRIALLEYLCDQQLEDSIARYGKVVFGDKEEKISSRKESSQNKRQ